MSGFSAPRDATTPAGSRRARRLVTSLALVAAVGLLPACDGGDRATNPADEAVFLLRACRGSIEFPEGRTFRILTRKPEVVAQGTSLVGAGNVKIVHGLVAAPPRRTAGPRGLPAPASDARHLQAGRLELAEVPGVGGGEAGPGA